MRYWLFYLNPDEEEMIQNSRVMRAVAIFAAACTYVALAALALLVILVLGAIGWALVT